MAEQAPPCDKCGQPAIYLVDMYVDGEDCPPQACNRCAQCFAEEFAQEDNIIKDIVKAY